jgi:SOUL heme-binding protein
VLSQVRTVVTQLVESVLSVAGIRVGTEEPSYTSRPLVDGVEIRRYGPRIAAETTVAANEEAARNAGFRRLAGYIFGRNHQDRRIDMTAPVAQQLDQRISQKIAMTAPVAQSSAGKQGWIIRFYMPAEWTMESLPTPNDERVRIVTQPAETVAVLRFTGDRSPQAVAARTGQLLEILRHNGIEPAGKPMTWFYDPPWTIPFRRRNEVVIPMERLAAV